MTKLHNQALIRLGGAIRQRRKALGLSQETVSFEAEIDRSYLSQVESGEKNPTYLVLLKIARALHTRLKELLPDEE